MLPIARQFSTRALRYRFQWDRKNMQGTAIEKYQAVAEIAAKFAQIGRKDKRIKNPPVGGAATHRGRTT